MISWNDMVVAAGALLVFLLYKEWRRKNRARLYGRLAASLLAVTSLLFMAYPYAGSRPGAFKKIILLTDGFVKDSLEDFLHQTNTRIPVFSVNPLHTGIKLNNPVQLVADWRLFAEKYKGDTLHIFGNGLSKESLALLHPQPIVFHASPALPAISHIYWNQHLQSGQPLILQGRYKNSSAQQIKIMLQAFGVCKDSVFFDAFASGEFDLQAIPVHLGRAVYSLMVTRGSDTLAKEPVPVEVQDAIPLQLLMIASSPDFENTYLKNYFSQQGYRFSITTTISNNKTNKQFVNMPVQQQADRLTVPYLKKFDVLMADEEALRGLSAAELDAIRSVIKDKGTGLLIKLDGQRKTGTFYSRFFPVKKLPQEKPSFILVEEAFGGSNHYKIKMTDPDGIEYRAGTQIILQDGQSNIYASGIIYGSGKIIATTLQNTYSIGLAGDRASYQQLWSLLLSSAAKKVSTAASWQTYPFISFVDNPVQLQTEENVAGVPRAVIGRAGIHFKQDPLLAFQWRGMYWPPTSGWQVLPQLSTQTGEWYVYKTGDWKQITDFVNLQETKNYAALQLVSPDNIAGQQAELLPVNWPLYLLIVFLICCIFLWVEQKTV